MAAKVKSTKQNLDELSEIELDYKLRDLDAGLERLQNQNEKLMEHYNRLKDKLSETTAKMLEKKRQKYTPTEDEQQVINSINSSTRKLNKLQKESAAMRNQLNGETGYVRMKELENLIYTKNNEIKNLEAENEQVKSISTKQKEYFDDVMMERGFSEKMESLDQEIKKLKQEIKNEMTAQNNRVNQQKSINNASVLIEKRHREACLKHNIQDLLEIKINKNAQNPSDTIVMKDIADAKQVTKMKKKYVDPKMKNPIYRGIKKDEKDKPDDLELENLKGLQMSENSYDLLIKEWKEIIANAS